MQAVGIKTALACILFGFSSLGPGGHFQADEGVSLRRDAGGHFAAEFPLFFDNQQLSSFSLKSDIHGESFAYAVRKSKGRESKTIVSNFKSTY